YAALLRHLNEHINRFLSLKSRAFDHHFISAYWEFGDGVIPLIICDCRTLDAGVNIFSYDRRGRHDCTVRIGDSAENRAAKSLRVGGRVEETDERAEQERDERETEQSGRRVEHWDERPPRRMRSVCVELGPDPLIVGREVGLKRSEYSRARVGVNRGKCRMQNAE